MDEPLIFLKLEGVNRTHRRSNLNVGRVGTLSWHALSSVTKNMGWFGTLCCDALDSFHISFQTC